MAFLITPLQSLNNAVEIIFDELRKNAMDYRMMSQLDSGKIKLGRARGLKTALQALGYTPEEIAREMFRDFSESDREADACEELSF